MRRVALIDTAGQSQAAASWHLLPASVQAARRADVNIAFRLRLAREQLTVLASYSSLLLLLLLGDVGRGRRPHWRRPPFRQRWNSSRRSHSNRLRPAPAPGRSSYPRDGALGPGCKLEQHQRGRSSPGHLRSSRWRRWDSRQHWSGRGRPARRRTSLLARAAMRDLSPPVRHRPVPASSGGSRTQPGRGDHRPRIRPVQDGRGVQEEAASRHAVPRTPGRSGDGERESLCTASLRCWIGGPATTS